MAFTKVVGLGIHTQSNINSHNINSTGIVTATRFDGPFTTLNITGVATFAGNVSIGGTLTYEDVTNIDSVGLVTARDGIFLPDNKKAKFGTNNSGNPRLSIWHSGSEAYIRNGGSNYSSGYLNLNSYYHRIGTYNGSQTFIYCEHNNSVFLNYQNATKFQTTSYGARVYGTLKGASEVGIQSGGVQIGAGITQLNFIGLGNTFAVNGTTVDVSISGNTGAGGTWSSYTAGIATTKSVGVNTNNLDDNDLVGVGNSFQGLYISNGMMITDNKLSGNHYIGTAFNGLMAGPVTVEGTLTIDGNYVVV